MQKKSQTVFVVDDDESIRKSLARLVSSYGYKVETCATAEEFLNHEMPGGAACLVLDVGLPGLDGISVQRQLAAKKDSLPVIFMTGRGNIPMSVQAMKDGAVDFLPKPFEEKVLMAAIELAVEKDLRRLKTQRAAQNRSKQFSILTPREIEVMRWVITGMLNKQIATKMGIVEKTIKVHRGRVMQKLRVQSVADLVRLTQKAGILPASH